MATASVQYRFNGEPRTWMLPARIEPGLHAVVMHLLQLHFGDGENSLVMPTAEDSDEQVLEQAARMGLTDIQLPGALTN
ncbi:hypothetical protein [Pseudomonas coleopterorum]|uniref:hypothetical protein n=1 Tax=Pseudomonas coleopterorum TaxID=1605838 RepID=UPI00089B25A7|nr:hypothetical protein [Pseudomonas coleopterorum]SEE37562.1 hypothetical protein SAMN05216510_2378 [Pseudomonas coleopterorum]